MNYLASESHVYCFSSLTQAWFVCRFIANSSLPYTVWSLVANWRMQTTSEREVDMAQPTGMLRAVVTEEDANRDNGLPDNPDDYKTKLLKYIPAEAVALYTALVGIPV